MARAYSLDLRERVVASVASGQPCRSVAELFDVSVASVVKWSQPRRSTGSPASKPMRSIRHTCESVADENCLANSMTIGL